MKLVWCPDTASKAYIDGVRAIAAAADYSDGGGSAELVAAMAGGWNAQLIVDAPADCAPPPPPPSAPSPNSPPATSLALAAAARHTGGRYARLDAHPDEPAAAAKAAMARLEGVDLLVVDARRRDAAAVLRAARPGPRGMVVVLRHADNTAASASASASAAPLGMMAAGTRLVRAAYLPIGAGGLEVLHVGVGEGPSLPTTTTQQHDHSSSRRRRHGPGGRWIRHVNHRTGEEHVFRRQ